FDRLRLWLEKKLDPGLLLQRTLCYEAARLTAAGIWIYQGLVPKLIFHQPDELAMLAAAGLTAAQALQLIMYAGWSEVIFGLLFVLRGGRELFILTVLLMILALIAVAHTSPGYLIAAFNPATLNVAVIALSAIGIICGGDRPSAGRCTTKKPEAEA